MRLTDKPRLACALLAAALAGCATVTTRVTVLDPAQNFSPAQHVAILFDFPPQPHAKIALIEAQGLAGGSEAGLLEAARTKAQVLGADAVVRLEVTSVYEPPVRVYDSWYGDPFLWRYRFAYRPFYFSPYPYDEYRQIGGGNVQTLKAVAIRYLGTGDGSGKAMQ